VSINETQAVNFELEQAMKKALDDLKEDLARKAASFLAEDRRKPDGIGYKQIRNLVALAQMAATPLEIKAFIEYQMGRDADVRKTNGWIGELAAGEPFGRALLKEIAEVEALAKKKIRQVELLAQNKCFDEKQFILCCLAQFFGYLSWRAKYVEGCLANQHGRQRNGGERRGGHR
jgi:hypothetical protein